MDGSFYDMNQFITIMVKFNMIWYGFIHCFPLQFLTVNINQVTVQYFIECPSDVVVPDLSGTDVVCSIPSSCSGIQCCINTPLLDTSIETLLLIEDCRNTLRLQIGQRKISIKLSQLSYDMENTFSLYGVINIM